MAYGRLDVFTPDGQFSTHQLDKDQLSVGRFEGNDIALDADGISRYHFTLTHNDGQVTITDLDSQNGTYVDGVRLNGNQPQHLFGGEEIQVGKLRIIYTFFDDSPTRPMSVPEDTTRRIELEAPTYQIDLNGPAQAVAPGSHISSELTITNTGDEKMRYVVELTGLPLEWVRMDHHEIEVAPQASEIVVISFKPLRRSDSAPGDYAVTINVRPRRESAVILQAHLTLRVLPYSGFGMALETNRLGTSGTFRLHLHNQGSAPLPLFISKRDRDEPLEMELSTANPVLAPGQRQIVDGTIRGARSNLFGKTKSHSFDLLVRSGDPSGFLASTRAYFLEKPALPTWTAYALGGAFALGLLIIAFALTVFFSQPTPPQIDTFTVNDVRLAQGEPLIVEWQARNVEAVHISVNGTPVFTGDESDVETQIDTQNYLGDVTVEIEAVNGSRTTSASEIVSIIQSMRVEYFTVEPSELVLNVFQPLSVSWSVPGAMQTMITGLDNFASTSIQETPLQASYGPTANLDTLVGYPTGPLTLNLIAQDSDGNEITETITIEVADPICQPVNDAVTLYSGPGTNYQAVGTVPAGSSVIVDALGPGGEWLRVASGVPGWGEISAFECLGFEIADLRKEYDIPTPVPTATPDTRTPEATDTTFNTATTPSPLVTPTPTTVPGP